MTDKETKKLDKELVFYKNAHALAVAVVEQAFRDMANPSVPKADRASAEKFIKSTNVGFVKRIYHAYQKDPAILKNLLNNNNGLVDVDRKKGGKEK